MTNHCRIVVIAGMLAMLLGTSGCSWIMVRQAPGDYSPETAEGPPDCTASLGPAIGDTWDTIAVGGGLVATGSLSIPLSLIDPVIGIAQIVGGVGLGAMFGASALHGYSATSRCRKLRDRFQTRLRERIDELETAPSHEEEKP